MMHWTIHLYGGPRRVNHAAVALGDQIYSFGGHCSGCNYKEFVPIDVFILNTKTFRWRTLPKPEVNDPDYLSWPFQCYGLTVCAYNGQIYLFGGRNDLVLSKVVYCFDPVKLKWTQPKVTGAIPPPLDGHSACVINKAMYIFGGYGEFIHNYCHDLYKLDLETFNWTLLPLSGDIPLSRDFHSATAIGDCMYVFGGRSSTSYITDYYSEKIMVFDTKTQVWHTPVVNSPFPCGRRSHSAINLDDKLMIFGGYNENLKKHLNDIWIFDPETLTWTQSFPLGDGPKPRRRQTLCQVGDKLFLFGGTSPYDDLTESQLAEMPSSSEENLIDHNDLYVIDLKPTLRVMCLVEVIKNKKLYDRARLPLSIKKDLEYMTKPNSISSV